MPHNQNRGMFLSTKMFFLILSCKTPENVPARKFFMDVARAGVGAP
jgi:hypothetical protein